MDSETRSKLLKIGGGMVSLGKSFAPESVGLDLRAIDEGSKGESGGGDTTTPKKDTTTPKKDYGSDIHKRKPSEADQWPQGLSNTSMMEIEYRIANNEFPKDLPVS